MAELADALDSGSSEGNFMQVQVLLPAPEIVDNIDDIYIVPFLCGFWVFLQKP